MPRVGHETDRMKTQRHRYRAGQGGKKALDACGEARKLIFYTRRTRRTEFRGFTELRSGLSPFIGKVAHGRSGRADAISSIVQWRGEFKGACIINGKYASMYYLVLFRTIV